jgi:hypothetical protein
MAAVGAQISESHKNGVDPKIHPYDMWARRTPLAENQLPRHFRALRLPLAFLMQTHIRGIAHDRHDIIYTTSTGISKVSEKITYFQQEF